MKNTARVGEHPLHPMLIPIPVGMWITSLIFDLMYIGTSNLLWYKVAYYMMLSGVIGAGIAALPGLVDYFTLRMSDNARSTATKHMLLNITILILYIINLFALRLDNGAAAGSSLGWAVFLNFVSVGLLAYSGWLGWKLVYLHGIAVSVVDADHELEAIGDPSACRVRMAGHLGGERPGESDQPHNI